MKKKTFLFFPVEIGLAHIVRGLSIAEELHLRGHTVYFALPIRKHKLFKTSPITFIDIQSFIDKDEEINIRSFSNYDFLNSLVNQELEMIKKYKPDAIIVDFRISAMAAGLITKTPTYFLSLGESLPYGSHLPNPGLPPFLYSLFKPFTGKIYHFVLTKYLEPVMKIVKNHNVNITWDSWFRKIYWILSEPLFYFPPYSKKLNLFYVGPLSWNGFQNETPEWLSSIQPNGKTVYITFGGTGFDKKKLINLSLLLINNGFRVIVSTGTIASPEDFPKKQNLFVAKFLPGKEITKQVDLIICHGGYGTMIEAIQNNTPVLSIPFNPDQIIHGWRMQELKVVKCLFTVSLLDLKEIFTFNWKKIEKKGKILDITIVLKETQKMLQNMKSYKTALHAFNNNYPFTNGAKQAADIIENNNINPFKA